MLLSLKLRSGSYITIWRPPYFSFSPSHFHLCLFLSRRVNLLLFLIFPSLSNCKARAKHCLQGGRRPWYMEKGITFVEFYCLERWSDYGRTLVVKIDRYLDNNRRRFQRRRSRSREGRGEPPRQCQLCQLAIVDRGWWKWWWWGGYWWWWWGELLDKCQLCHQPRMTSDEEEDSQNITYYVTNLSWMARWEVMMIFDDYSVMWSTYRKNRSSFRGSKNS